MIKDDLNTFLASTDLIAKLREYGIEKTFQEGDVILRENAYSNSIPIVKAGAIKVLRTDEDGREMLLYYIQSGESCVMSFFGALHQDTSKVKGIAEEETEILFVPIGKVTQLIKDYPEWLNYIFKLYHKRFEELLEVVNEIAFKKMDQRILSFIHKRVELTKNKTITVTHETLANELGTARVVVSRLLKQMEDEGLVKLGRNKIILN